MNKNIKYLLYSLLFCLIFIVSYSINIYAISGTVKPDGTGLTDSSGKVVATIDEVKTAVKNDYAKKFKEMAEDKYSDTSIIEEIKASSGDNISMAATKEQIVDRLSAAGTDVITFSFETSKAKYDVKTYTTHVNVTIDGVTQKVAKNTPEAANAGDATELQRQYDIAMGAIEFLNNVTGSTRIGLMGGSISYGYNVGVVYSMTQKSLYDLMEKKDNGTYDYKNMSAMKTAFEFYYGPIAGKINAVGESKLPTTDDEWITLLQSKNFISGNSVIIDPGFLQFSRTLSKEQMNDEGFKITDTIRFPNGVQPFKGIANVKQPDSVISYTMKMAYPYVFYNFGTNYKLDMNNLRIEESYYYCVYNDYIYERLADGTLSRITDRGELGIERTQIFSYYQDMYEDQEGSDEQKRTRIGVILIAEFDEAVVDTTDSGKTSDGKQKYYGTGRKIGFNNGYSDLLLFDKANVNLMFTDSEGGKEAFVPKNIAFRCTTEDGEKIMQNVALLAETQVQGTKKRERLPVLTDDEVDENAGDVTNHIEYLENPPYFKIYVKLHRLVNFESESKLKEQQQQQQIMDVSSHYGVIIVRNNKYINDPSLKAWLRTNTARSKSFVEADKLLALIEGDFTSHLDKPTYEVWKQMQEIKKENDYNKDMWLIRVMNVMSILMGIFLIVFAILICLAYWIDVLNTLTDFSVLQFISFGRMFPVATDEAETYLRESKGKTKYVKFKDVLVIAFVCCAIGILFMEVSNVVQIIVNLYNYIMETIGGK